MWINFTLVQQLGRCRTDLFQLGVTWNICLRELLCHREEELNGMRIFLSESVVFHVLPTVQLCGVRGETC